MIGYYTKLNYGYIEHTFVFENELYVYNKTIIVFPITLLFNISYLLYRFIRYGRIKDINLYFDTWNNPIIFPWKKMYSSQAINSTIIDEVNL